MDKVELSKLLTIASVIDNRTVAPETVDVWHTVVSHIDFPIALEAVQLHFRESTDYLMPGHVAANARRVRDRLESDERRKRLLEPTAINPDEVSFDRAKHDAEVYAAIEYHRTLPAKAPA